MRLTSSIACVFFVLLVCRSSLFGINGITFEGPVTIPNVPRPPVTVHSGDFNHDGKIDLVTSNGTAITTVLFQDPQDREHWINTPLRVGSAAFFARGGDFDGDGIDDLAVADGASTSYFIRSNGDGTFATPIAIREARGSRWIATGDWNKDGRLDMASSNLNTSTLTIFVNEENPEGGLIFRQTQNQPSGREHTLEALDYDGDGLTDLSLGTGLPGIQLHKGQGDGKFVYTQRNVNVLGCVEYISTGDFNADGFIDLAPTCIDDGNAYVGLSKGDGTYTRAMAIPFASGTESSAIADFNSDGFDDLALVSAGSGTLRIYLSTGADGKFQLPIEFAPTGAGPLFLIALDLDQDGYQDVVSADTGGSSLTIFYGRAGERFLQSADSITGFGAARGFSVEDFDNDGAPDVILTASSSPKGFIYLKPGGTSPTKPSVTFELQTKYTSLATGDLNGDGVVDLAGSNLTADAVVTALMKADGTILSEIALTGGDAPQEIRVAQIDDNSTLDLLVPASSLNQILIHPGKGDGAFLDPVTIPTIERPRRCTVADIDGDGRVDVLVISPKLIVAHYQAVGGTFSEPFQIAADPAKNYVDADVGDVTGDGLPDIVIGETRTLSALVYAASGARTFHDPVSIKMRGSPLHVALIDVDGNGALDITISSSSTQAVEIALNEGGTNFSAVEQFRVGTSATSHRIRDMNQDGVIDIVGFGATAVTIRLGKLEQPTEFPMFRRGDADANGRVELNDAIATLNFLFRESDPLTCADAADVDDNGQLALTDAVFLLNWLFLEGDEPRPPGPTTCAPDPDSDELETCEYRC